MNLLDHLSQPTKTGFTFQQGDVHRALNDILELSARVYEPALHQVCVDEMELYTPARELMPEEMRAIRNGTVPEESELPLRSKRWDEKISESVIMVYNSEGIIAGVVVNAKPKDGYEYKAGKNEDSSPIVHAHFPGLTPQAHIWEALFRDDVQRQGLGTFALAAAARLSEREGARFITLYASAYAKDKASTQLAEKLRAEIGLQFLAEFPMLNGANEITNIGRLYALDMHDADVQRRLAAFEADVAQRLF